MTATRSDGAIQLERHFDAADQLPIERIPYRHGALRRQRLKAKQLMKLSHFFIDRPIFGIVISIVTVLLGAIAYTVLPVAQFPEIAPPTIVVQA